MSNTNICSVCSLKFLPQALTMIWSLERHAEKYRFHVFLSDITSSEGAAISEKFPGVLFHFIDQFADLRILDIALLLTNLEFNVALKARAMRHVLERYGGSVLYCDSDLFFISEPHEAIEALLVQSVLVTPHQIAPTNDAAEFAMARTGVFNSGFVGASGAMGHSFVRWWDEKCMKYCLLEPEEGLFVDQKWLDLAPAIFDEVITFRHPGYNLAYWNLNTRSFEGKTVLLHLSGLDPARPLAPGDKLSKYSDLRVDAHMASVLAPYFVQFSRIASDLSEIRIVPGDSTAFGRLITDERSVISKRYSAQKFQLVFDCGMPRQRIRPPQNRYDFIRLYRREMAITRFSRRVGKLLTGAGLGSLIENMISLFRVLGRRSNWLE